MLTQLPAWRAQCHDWFADPEVASALALGTADQVCPNCGRAEKLHIYCSLCYRPTQRADVRIHPAGDTHGCVYKRVPDDAKNGGWGDPKAPKWSEEMEVIVA